MLRYEPGSTVVHRLDPRSKLLFQAGFAVAAYAHTTPEGLVVLTGVTLAVLAAARLSPLAAARDLRFALPLLVVAPVLAGLTFGSPWFSVAQARFPALASYRVLLLLFVSAAYVHTTASRESRAAVQWLVPGKPGQFLGMTVALVFRFLPVVLGDLVRAREAMQARAGTERPLATRMQIVATSGLRRAFARSDALALALQARCYAWNPTLPRLTPGARDVPVVLVAGALFASVLL